MGDRRAPSQENSSGPGNADAHDSSARRGNIYYNHYTVNNVGNVAGTAIFGDNHGTVNGGSGARQPAAGSQDGSDTELDTLLAPILDASYTRNRKISPPDSDCFPGTREGVIKGITDWADSPVLFNADAPHVFWTHGYVGCGKSSISQAVSQKYGRKGRLLGSFFFYRNSGDRSKMTRFAVTLASQMMAVIPATAPFHEAAVKAEPALLTRRVSLTTQLERLVYKPFRAAVKGGLKFKTLFQGPFLVVIDGLDECEDKEEVKEFIKHLLDFFKRYPSTPLRFFITSRVECHIQECLTADGVQLDDLVAHGSDDDILTFLETSFFHRAKEDKVIAAYIKSNGQWPARNDMKTLVRHIGGSFIFASALFKYIVGSLDDGLTPMTRLPLTLDMNPGLDGLYAYTLARSQRLPHFSDVISTIALLFEPISITAIAELLGIQTFEVLHILVNLQAVIHIPGTDELPVTFCHTSLRDFLTTESRSGRFFAPPSFHIHLTNRCYSLEKQRRSGTAAASYIEGHLTEHLQTLDAVYPHILAKSQDIPHFFDTISTITLLFEPLSTVGIADLLGIESSDVSRVLASLQGIIDSPGIDEDKPVAMHHTFLHNFLTTKTRSGTFFVSPSYHLKLSYRCFSLNLEHQLNNTLLSSVTQYSKQHHRSHWKKFLGATSDSESILAELKQLPHLPNQILPYHLFSFAQVLSWLFGNDSDHRPQQVLHALTRCIESLALALECDPAPDRWLQMTFKQLGFHIDFPGNYYAIGPSRVYRLNIYQEHAMTLQRNIQHMETEIGAKCPSILSESLSNDTGDINRFIRQTRNAEYLYNWTPMDAYRLFKWMNGRVQVGMNLAGPGVPCDFNLSVNILGEFRLNARPSAAGR